MIRSAKINMQVEWSTGVPLSGTGAGTGAAFIEPGSPWQNAYVESFNARARDEL